MRKIRLVTFTPLCYTLMGVEAIKQYNLPPYIDSSCRREPDLQNEYPSITALCRGSKLAPHLRVRDIVIYFSKQRKYKVSESYLPKDRYKMVSILEVIKVCSNHEEARDWYSKKGLEVPSNCMVDSNPPETFHYTGGNFPSQKEMKAFLQKAETEQRRDGGERVGGWNYHYQLRANEHTQFNITKPIYIDVYEPTDVLKTDLVQWFGKVPSTQSPKIVDEDIYKKMLELVKQ